MDNKKIGEFISSVRKEKGYSQKQLAELLFITDKAVSKWETGKGSPDISNLIPLADALDVSVIELLSGNRVDNDVEQSNKVVVDAMFDTKSNMRKQIFKKLLSVFMVIVIIIASISTVWYTYWGRRHMVLYDLDKVYMTQMDDGYKFRISVTARNWLINSNKIYAYCLQPSIGGERDFDFEGRSDYLIIKGLSKTKFVISGVFYPSSMDAETAKSEMAIMNFITCLDDRYCEELSGANLYMQDYPDVEYIFN